MNDRVSEYAKDVLRLRTESSVLRQDCTSTGNNEGSPYEDPSKLVPLLPPFMQITRQKFSSVEKSLSQVSRETADRDVTQHAYLVHAEKIVSFENGATVLPYSNFGKDAASQRKNSKLNRSEKISIKSDVSYEDTKVTNDAICQASHGSNPHKTECFAKVSEQYNYLEPRESDHCECSEDFQKDGTDYQEWGNVGKDKARWTLAHCESLLLSSESDQEDRDPNTTDPLLAHELHISPGIFDLRGRTKELLKRQNIVRARRYLWESKNRISLRVKQVFDADADFDSIICMLMIRALCEQVILTMAGVNTGIDVHTFINIVIIWALVDLQILDPDTLDEQEFAMFTELGLFDINTCPGSREAVETVGTSKLRRDLFEMHRPKFDPRVLTQLHRCLPWALVSPAHERGVVRFYPNARQRIDERLPDPSEHVKLAYVPDLTCFHLREVPDKAYVAYKRKSKSLPIPRKIDSEQDDELFVQLVSFV